MSGLFFGDNQVTFNDEKTSNEQGFWLDDNNVCSRLTTLGFYFVTEIKFKNGKVVSSPCDDP